MADLQQILDSRPSSVGALFEERVARSTHQEAYRYPDVDEQWVSLTWGETRDRVFELAAGLLSLGLQYEDRVAIASGTRIEWVLLDIAINCAACATTTIYPNTQGPEFAHIVAHSDAKVFVAENEAQVVKLDGQPGLREQVHHVILFDGSGNGDTVLTLDDLAARGRERLAADPDCVRRSIDSCTPDTLATLIYTSGTTGLPKGVELLHGSWTYEAVAVESLKIIEPGALQYFWLPLSHVFGKAVMMVGFTVGFASAVDGRIDRIMPGLGATNPDFMCGAPRIFEKVRNAVKTSSPSGGVKGRISRWAFAVGRDSRPYRLAGTPLPRALAVQYALADRLVFSKLKDRMGGRIKFFISGSAKLSSQVQEWFYSAGILVIEGYGMTETSAVSFVNVPQAPRFGTVGPVLPGTEVRLAEDGEILLRGPGVMRGYHKDPERTAEVLAADGWFATGDIGVLDADGYLTITDRKKDLMKTSGGKYVAPQKVESVLAANIPYISQAVAVGDGRKYVSAILTLDAPALAKWAKNHGKEGLSYAELTQLPEIRRSIDRFMARANAKLERWETVKRYAILDHEFTVEQGDVTANMKVRRNIITEKYSDVADSLYDDEVGQ